MTIPRPDVLFALALACGTVLAANAPSARAGDEPAPGELALTTERVVVFKDGHGLFVKTARGTADAEGAVFTHEVPDNAVLGTVWAVAERPAGELTMRAGWVESVETRTAIDACVDMRGLLRANVGREVTLLLTDETRRSGRILEVLERSPGDDGEEGDGGGDDDGDGDDGPPVLRPASSGPAERSVTSIVPLGGELVVLALGEGSEAALPVASVRSVEGSALNRRCEREETITTRRKRLAFDLGEAAAGRPVSLRILYFTPGIRWIPTYRLLGDLEAAGRLELQGEILNEVEDIDGAALDLVVGVPNFRFREVVSPFALEGTLVKTLEAAAPGVQGQLASGHALRSSEWPGAMDSSAPAAPPTGVVGELAAAAEHDLFVYGKRELTLPRGARAAVTLWRDDVALEHVYTLDIGLVRDGRSGATSTRGPGVPGGEAPPLELARHRVWHQLELVNDSDVPWTTGPVMLLRNGVPLGQELLTYTPRGAGSLLPITVAVDVRASHDEQEVERQPDALRWGGATFALVRKEGTITLASFRSEPTALRVTLEFGGRAASASDGGTIRLDDFRSEDWAGGRWAVNHSEIVWDIELKPGEETTLTYTCSFYVR